MASFESFVHSNSATSLNFKGYVGNPPTTKAEYELLDCWYDASIRPAWEEVSAGMALAEVQENRKMKYPDIGVQLDMLYHDIKTGNLESGNWISAIEEIKEAFPKP